MTSTALERLNNFNMDRDKIDYVEELFPEQSRSSKFRKLLSAMGTKLNPKLSVEEQQNQLETQTKNEYAEVHQF